MTATKYEGLCSRVPFHVAKRMLNSVFSPGIDFLRSALFVLLLSCYKGIIGSNRIILWYVLFDAFGKQCHLATISITICHSQSPFITVHYSISGSIRLCWYYISPKKTGAVNYDTASRPRVSQSLTFPGVYESLLHVNRSKLTRKEALDVRHAKIKPYDVGLQVSSHLDCERP